MFYSLDVFSYFLNAFFLKRFYFPFRFETVNFEFQVRGVYNLYTYLCSEIGLICIFSSVIKKTPAIAIKVPKKKKPQRKSDIANSGIHPPRPRGEYLSC